MKQTIYLDISRLLLAAWRETPSGIERVELAYAKELGVEQGTEFVAGLFGHLHHIPRRDAEAFLNALEKSWQARRRFQHAKTICSAIFINLLLLGRFFGSGFYQRRQTNSQNPVYANLSHENLVNRRAVMRFKSRTTAKLLFFIHDLIPITYPEYARPGQAKRHSRRIATVGDLADIIIVNSLATKKELLHHLRLKSATPAIHVIHLGVTAISGPADYSTHDAEGVIPYFICLATLEPRKNHLLLLHVWRSLANAGGLIPRLIIVGRRGWENEMVLDMLQRCQALSGWVEERSGVADEELRSLISGARALLLPSFAEGYGLPVAEALSLGTPVICSDLPALREVGGDVPEYLDPLDGLGWRQAILDYANSPSPRRAAQCARLGSWAPPLWEAHFSQVRNVLKTLAAFTSPPV